MGVIKGGRSVRLPGRFVEAWEVCEVHLTDVT